MDFRGMTTNFFLDTKERTMATPMSQVRSMLPIELQSARLATIAQDKVYRPFFATGDDSTAIRGILRRIYEVKGNKRELEALKRQLAKQARSRRAIVGARRRRERSHRVAQAVASFVQGESRSQRLARRRAMTLLRQRQRAFREARRPVGADLQVHYFNSQKARVYATGHLLSYSDGIRRAAIDFYQSLPPQWRAEGVDISLRYDFYASNAANDNGVFLLPARLQTFHFTQRYDSDGVALEAYYDHEMTRLDQKEDDEERRVASLQEMLNVVENHLMNRINLRALWGDHLPHYQSCLSQLERVSGVQMTPVNSYLSDLLPP